MLFPKPLIIKREMDAHAHKAEHDDQHNEKSIPLQDKPGTVVLDQENHALLQEVEYHPKHQEDDWRAKHQTQTVSSYKLKDLLVKEP